MKPTIDVNKELGYDPDLVAQEIMEGEKGAPVLTVNAFDPAWHEDSRELIRLKEARRDFMLALMSSGKQTSYHDRKKLRALETLIDNERKRLSVQNNFPHEV